MVGFCYNVADVYADEQVGGVIGALTNALSTGNYYLEGCARDITGTVQNGIGTQQGKSLADLPKNTISLTADKMKSQSSFEGFDFAEIWEMSESSDYPHPTIRTNSHECHKWGEGEKITDPTEKSYGEIKHTCTDCREIKIEPIAKLNSSDTTTDKVTTAAPKATESPESTPSVTTDSTVNPGKPDSPVVVYVLVGVAAVGVISFSVVIVLIRRKNDRI